MSLASLRTFFLFSVICGVSVCTAACTLASLCQMVVRSSGKEPSSVPVRPACRDSRISTSVAASLRASSSSCRRASNHHFDRLLRTVRWSTSAGGAQLSSLPVSPAQCHLMYMCIGLHAH